MNVNGSPIALGPVIGAQGSRMLRITVVESDGSAVTLRVEGRIAGAWVEELRTTCNVHTGPDQIQLHLELEDVSFADSAGVAFLRELRDQGVGLLHVSPFLNELFENDSSPDGS
jgi:ABC-type transporter Mla MlaB component